MVGCLWFRGEWFQGFKKKNHKTRKSRVCMLQIQAWMSTCTIDFYKQSSITDRKLVESKCHVVSGLKPRQLSSRHTLEWPCVDSAMLQEFTIEVSNNQGACAYCGFCTQLLDHRRRRSSLCQCITTHAYFSLGTETLRLLAH